MKNTGVWLTVICLVLVFSAVISTAGCAKIGQAEDLMSGIIPQKEGGKVQITNEKQAITDFALRLLRENEVSGENVLVSPLSVLCALALTVNGAEGETRQEMERVIGMDTDKLNSFLSGYFSNLPAGEKYKLSLANSIWFTDDESFKVNQGFLQKNADFYGADIYKTAFNSDTCKQINEWVSQKTDGMIEEILDSVPQRAVMYLVNALAFDAEWEEIYTESHIGNGIFTKEDWTEQTVEFMSSEEGVYLSDGKAVGFMKYYSGRKYAFAALLPDENTTVSEYIASLDGAALNKMLSEAEKTRVLAYMPKFKTEYGKELSEALRNMGMPLAFDRIKAQFGGLGSAEPNNIYIGRVLHKTFMSVDEKGTKAGAATVVEMLKNEGIVTEQPKRVYLNRPFVYMIVDCENNVPVFMGIMNDVEG